MPTVAITVDVDVELDEFSDDDLIAELEDRGVEVSDDTRERARIAVEMFNTGRRNGGLKLTKQILEEISGQYIFGELK